MPDCGTGSNVDRPNEAEISMVSRVLSDIWQDALRLSLEAHECFQNATPMPPSTDRTTERLVKSREMLFVAARLSQIVLWVVKEEHEHRPTNEPNIDAPAPWIADQLLMTAAPHEAEAFADEPRIEALRTQSLSLYCRVARLKAQADAVPA
jgi:hypothetical protein